MLIVLNKIKININSITIYLIYKLSYYNRIVISNSNRIQYTKLTTKTKLF